MSSMLGMASSDLSSRLSAAMETTSQWDFSQDIPSDIVVQIGDATFQLHKFVLASKSGYITRKVMESESANLSCIDLSDLSIGAEVFERVAKFCYGVNFEISVRNVAALRCAAEYLQMTEEYCRGNLAARTEEFINQAAVKTLPGAVALLRSCEGPLLPMAESLRVVQRSVDAISLKACKESNRPTRSPPNWWAGELAVLSPTSLQMILIAMKSRGADPKSLAAAVVVYAENFLPHLLHPSSGASAPAGGNDRTRERSLLESVVSILLPDCDAPLPVGFIFYLLRAAIFLEASEGCRRELERRASACLDQATVADLLTITLDYAGERVVDLETARRIVAGFAEREAGGGGGAVYKGDSGAAGCSAAVQKVARTVDSFVGKIASDEELSVSKFTGIAGVLPKSARRFDDDLYRAVDIYLKAHPGLDEIEREKASSVIDPLKLSYEARLHASQNKRLPLQIVLHALYYDQLKQRSGMEDEAAAGAPGATLGPDHGLNADVSLIRENEALRSELKRMKMYVSELHRGGGGQGSGVKARSKKTMFFSSVSRTLGKLNPFKQGSKDTSNMDDGVVVDVTKPRRRRFSIS
ncbi:root phototropism protein 2-like isoform X1 [Musa acuminata AAA Group]|uniref:root phototropism protein 2-like isoform X1 n=1 Tax=Musa acuminata AAA Group TaxID=214697 RepID=UPI0031DE025A